MATSIDEKLKEILSWLNKHDLSKEAEELKALFKEASNGAEKDPSMLGEKPQE
jgi:hypothetical protein